MISTTDEHVDVETRDRDDGARDEQDRVAGQERAYDEPRLREDHEEQDAVEPRRRTARRACASVWSSASSE